MRRGELAAPGSAGESLPDLPLWLAVADSQGGIGHLLAAALYSTLGRRDIARGIAAIVTHTSSTRRIPDSGGRPSPSEES